MARVNKGKKRALPGMENDADSLSSLTSQSPPPLEEPKAKKSKKAVTRPCPICQENIPLRLLGKHSELELLRVDGIFREPMELEAGPSSGRRGAAVKARKSMTALHPRSTSNLDMLEQVDRMIRLVKRNRKNRHTKLKEIIAQEDGPVVLPRDAQGAGSVCPVCLVSVYGDDDVVQAHVDACLAHANQRQAESAERQVVEREREESGDVDAWGEVEVDGQVRLQLRNSAGLRGTGFHVRDANQLDIEDDIDVDGDDEAVFGDAQFTERDVLEPSLSGGGSELVIDINNEDEDEDVQTAETSTLRDLVAQGKVISRMPESSQVEGLKAEMEEVLKVGDTDRLDRAIHSAKGCGDAKALISALEDKVKQLESMRVSSSTSSLCRICLDPYKEPTVSTGCWHTCCRDCWLRCLGLTKLCPICKRITAASDLRRIYM